MNQRRLGNWNVSAVSLGCMNLSHAYGTPPPPAVGEAVILRALELGVNHFDTAALYGFGANEELVGRVLRPHRSRIILASKCGISVTNGKRAIDSTAPAIRQVCEESLKRLGTDVIDLYYMHRWDKKTPIEESIGALADLIKAGKIRAIGLSEVSAQTLRRAHAVHPIAAVQSEYSLWSRNPEIAVLQTCRELGIALVAFSPLGRGFLAGELRDVSTLVEKDLRRAMPRFSAELYPANLKLLDEYAGIAREVGCTQAQLALAWVMAKGDDIIPIPGTTQIAHLEENLAAEKVKLSAAVIARLDALINERTVKGGRYNAATQAEIDTEQFA
jgi:aryl-alcohol dehydrogenase-like predicted oxidoreductase